METFTKYRHQILILTIFVIVLSSLISSTRSGVFAGADEAFRYFMVENLRNSSFSELNNFKYSHFVEDKTLEFNPYTPYIREKNNNLVGQYRPYFPYLANIFYDGKNTKQLLIITALFSLLSVFVFHQICQLFVNRNEAFWLTLFYAIGTPFLTYSFRFQDVNIAIFFLLSTSFLILKFQKTAFILLGFLTGVAAFILFKSESILFLISLALSLAFIKFKSVKSPISFRSREFYLISSIVITLFLVFIIAGVNMEHLQKHIFSMNVLLNNYLNLEVRLKVIDVFFFNPMPFGLGLETLLGQQNPVHLAGLSIGLFIILVITRIFNTSITSLLANKYVSLSNALFLFIGLMFFLTHKSSNPQYFNRYSFDLFIVISAFAILLFTQITYPFVFKKYLINSGKPSLAGKEFLIISVLCLISILLILIQDKMVRGMFTSTPFLMLSFFSLLIKSNDRRFNIIKLTFFIYIAMAVMAPTAGGYQWGPRYLQAIIPFALILSWVTIKESNQIAQRLEVSQKFIKFFSISLAIMTILMTVKGSAFILGDISDRSKNDKTLSNMTVDYIFHKQFPVQYPSVLFKSYALRDEKDIIELLRLINKADFNFAAYNLKINKLDEALNKSDFTYSKQATQQIIIDAAPDIKTHHQVFIYTIREK